LEVEEAHAKLGSDLSCVVGNDRELDLGLQVVLDSSSPLHVRDDLISGQADKAAVELVEPGPPFLNGHEFGGADEGKIRRVREGEGEKQHVMGHYTHLCDFLRLLYM
jgi:hypothetical protein